MFRDNPKSYWLFVEGTSFMLTADPPTKWRHSSPTLFHLGISLTHDLTCRVDCCFADMIFLARIPNQLSHYGAQQIGDFLDCMYKLLVGMSSGQIQSCKPRPLTIGQRCLRWVWTVWINILHLRKSSCVILDESWWPFQQTRCTSKCSVLCSPLSQYCSLT